MTKPVTAVWPTRHRHLFVCENAPPYTPRPPIPLPESNWKPLHNRRELGITGETAVVDHYVKNGYTILERNWRAGRYAEIDLIARDRRGMLVFVEVKTRIIDQLEFGFVDHGFNAVHSRKRRKILTAGRSYAAHNANIYTPCRFDVVVVEFHKGCAEPKLNVIMDAFHA